MLKIKKVNENAIPPKRSKQGDSGLDLFSCENCIIKPGERRLISTGFQMSVPEGYEIQIRTRSGLAIKNGIVVGNSPGTCDSNFRGEVKVILFNLGNSDFLVTIGSRVAQMVVAQVELWEPEIVEELSETDRGSSGFGSTGV